jgi:hypothetical protein
MNHYAAQGAWAPLARIGRHVAAIVADCNYANTRLISVRNAPGAWPGRGN